jgi:hypothetical protein
MVKLEFETHSHATWTLKRPPHRVERVVVGPMGRPVLGQRLTHTDHLTGAITGVFQPTSS